MGRSRGQGKGNQVTLHMQKWAVRIGGRAKRWMHVKQLRKGVKRTRENEVVCEGPVLYSKQLTGRCEGGDIYTADRKQSAAPKFKWRFSKT